MDDCTLDSSRIWKNVRNTLGWISGGPPQRIVFKGKLYTKPVELAVIMNKFFVEKIDKLLDRIPISIKDPLSKVKTISESIQSKFDLQCVHPDQVIEIINKLKCTNSCGLDNIDSYVIKLAKYQLVPAITHIINLSILKKRFPSQWKCAKVVPLLKRGDVTDPKNYRPVALLSVLSKIMERVIFDQMIKYLEGNEIIHP